MTIGRSSTRPVLSGCRIIVSVDARVPGRASAASAAVDDQVDRILERAGAEVTRVVGPGAAARTPVALSRAVHRAGSGGADAVLFTASTAPWLDAVADAGALEANRQRAESERLILVTVDEREACLLHEVGLPARHVEPSTPAGLVHSVLAHYRSGAGSHLTVAGRLQVRSGGVVLDERFIPLSRGAVALIEALFLARGRVLSRAELGRALPGGHHSDRAVEVAVGRLRESLGPTDVIQTVVKRGYRLAMAER
ncbi:winged helix-turn-helix domain-containing protein [Microbacterium oxydans]|uniref:winged helix-turn-helix domain-containing protein n=1 Tax=Microbacterium oxydans TaxID=82380 RepID=UPI0006991BFF|nr:winged helix-turn-helix domain-containing protein [Microbacterium oxydans]